MTTNSDCGLWEVFSQEIEPRLDKDGDPGLWRVALDTILCHSFAKAEAYTGKDAIIVEVGRCSHWIRPHWKTRAGIAWPYGYQRNIGNAFSFSSVPAFDWSLRWTQDAAKEEWTLTSVRNVLQSTDAVANCSADKDTPTISRRSFSIHISLLHNYLRLTECHSFLTPFPIFSVPPILARRADSATVASGVISPRNSIWSRSVSSAPTFQARSTIQKLRLPIAKSPKQPPRG